MQTARLMVRPARGDVRGRGGGELRWGGRGGSPATGRQKTPELLELRPAEGDRTALGAGSPPVASDFL